MVPLQSLSHTDKLRVQFNIHMKVTPESQPNTFSCQGAKYGRLIGCLCHPASAREVSFGVRVMVLNAESATTLLFC